MGAFIHLRRPLFSHRSPAILGKRRLGSRDFNGTTDRIDWPAVVDLTGSPLTIAAWIKLDAIPANGYIFTIHRLGDTALCIVLNVITNGVLDFVRSGTTQMLRVSANGVLTTGVWTHVIVTHTGAANYTTAKLYKNGAETAYGAGNASLVGEYAPLGSWSAGGRIFDDTRNINGKLAQVAVYNDVLSAGNLALLAGGRAPSKVAPANLVFYFKGDTVSLTASPGGAGTADGTTQLVGVGNGPKILY